MAHLILASGSSARSELLSRLDIPFDVIVPNINETRYPNEPFTELVSRLSVEKANMIAKNYPASWVIGSDQICICDEQLFGKPLTTDNAIKQLQFFSGKKVSFYTGICLVNAHSHQTFLDIIPYHVTFRHLSDMQITNYIQFENVLECAGSFKSEGLGVRLFEKMEGNDPTSLQGLPLIRTCDFLEWAHII